MDATALKDRTLGRNAALWQKWDLDGLTGTLQSLEDLVNEVSGDIVRMPVAVIEGAAQSQAEQRDKLHDLDMQEVETHSLIAKEKFETQIKALAYKKAGEEALLAAKRYDVAVQSFIMSAKEFAAEVERDQIALQRDRAKMDIRKEQAHLEETKAKILLEYTERAQVEVDIAKAKLQVAQANVRAVMAEIEAREAELKAIQAELEIAMTQAEKATLVADIAMIYADIIVRGLAKIKLAVETAEIEAGFEFIEQKLSDLLAIWDTKTETEKMRLTYEALLRQEVVEQTAAQKQLEELKKTQQKADIEVFFFEKDKVDGSDEIQEVRPGGRSYDDKKELHDALEGAHFQGEGQTMTECEITRQDNLYDEKAALFQTKADAEKSLDKVRSWAEVLLAKAHKAIAGYREILDYELRFFGQKIHKGEFYVKLPSGAESGKPPDKTPPKVQLENRTTPVENCDDSRYQGPEDM